MPEASNADFKITIDGEEVEADGLHSLIVETDINQPDMCVATLNNGDHKWSHGTQQGATVEVKVEMRGGENGGGGGPKTLFKGEVVGVEPMYVTGEESRCVIRAFNRMHRLLRGRKSRTFLDESDSAIVGKIAKEHGLKAEAKPDPDITHKYVYQHNQTDMEFLRLRASRIGCVVLVDDTTLKFSKPDATQDPTIELIWGAGDQSPPKVTMKKFFPRLSSANVVSKVIVRAWDPIKKEEIVGEAAAKKSPMGKDAGYSKMEKGFSKVETFNVDYPVFSKEEADALAKSRLYEKTMSYITGEGRCVGNAEIKAGIFVKVKVRPDDADRFNGKYFVMGATHRYNHNAAGADGGYLVDVRVRREAESE